MKVKNFLNILTLGSLIAGVAACSKAPSETSADSTAPVEKPSGILDKLKPENEVK